MCPSPFSFAIWSFTVRMWELDVSLLWPSQMQTVLSCVLSWANTNSNTPKSKKGKRISMSDRMSFSFMYGGAHRTALHTAWRIYNQSVHVLLCLAHMKGKSWQAKPWQPLRVSWLARCFSESVFSWIGGAFLYIELKSTLIWLDLELKFFL